MLRQVETSERPWGTYAVLHEMPDHKVKTITVAPGQRLSYQTHERRSEHWHVISGRGVITLDGTDVEISAGSTVDIPVRVAHRVANPGSDPLVFIEIQRGDYFGEDDITRLDDDYGRTGTV
jgi:mannose-6-phosphate isomerase